MAALLSKLRRPLRPALRLVSQPLNSARLRVVDRVDNPAVQAVVRALRKHQANATDHGREMIAGIESERHRLLSCQEMLCDGTLPVAFEEEQRFTIRQVCQASRPKSAAKMLYRLVREIRPRSALEIGTNVGISGAYIATALLQNGDGGTLVTLEGSAYRQRLAKHLFERLNLNNTRFVEGMFQDTLEPTVSTDGPFDFAFIDGHHQYEPTLRYMDLIWQHSVENAVFLFDDIRWSPEMRKAWTQIKSDARIAVALDLNTMGVCVMRRSQGAPPLVVGPLYFL